MLNVIVDVPLVIGISDKTKCAILMVVYCRLSLKLYPTGAA
jgi:hypothetical protein